MYPHFRRFVMGEGCEGRVTRHLGDETATATEEGAGTGTFQEAIGVGHGRHKSGTETHKMSKKC